MKAYFYLVIVMLIFSSNLLLGKAISEVSPLIITFFRFVIAVVVLIPISWNSLKEHKQLWRKEWKVLLALSISGMALFQTLLYFSLRYTSPTNVAIIETTIPIFAIGLGVFILKREQLTVIQAIGVFLSLTGAVWVITKGSMNVILNLNFNIGDFIMLGAVVVWVVYSLLVKQHNLKFPTYSGLLVMCFMSAVIMLPFAGWELVASAPDFTIEQIISILYMGIFPSVIALVLWNKAVEDIGPSKASVFFNTLPVFTMVGSAVFLGERIQPAQVIGFAFVLIGVFLTTKRIRVKKGDPLLTLDDENMK